MITVVFSTSYSLICPCPWSDELSLKSVLGCPSNTKWFKMLIYLMIMMRNMALVFILWNLSLLQLLSINSSSFQCVVLFIDVFLQIFLFKCSLILRRSHVSTVQSITPLLPASVPPFGRLARYTVMALIRASSYYAVVHSSSPYRPLATTIILIYQVISS